MNNIWIIAQAGNGDAIPSGPLDSPGGGDTESVVGVDGSNGDTAAQEPQTKSPTPLSWFLPIAMIIMVVLMLRAPQKQKKERKKLEQTLEKNDRILTIGGIFGTIVDIKDDEITLKIDESNNTKIKVTRSAIGRNVSKS